ncbi:MAG: hypothetical protein ACO34C_04120 [Candidatus Kapaibacteriota bacterium]
MQRGGTATAILNAANEIAVQAFLENKARFLQIPQTIESALNMVSIVDNPTISDIDSADKEARDIARGILQ